MIILLLYWQFLELTFDLVHLNFVKQISGDKIHADQILSSHAFVSFKYHATEIDSFPSKLPIVLSAYQKR